MQFRRDTFELETRTNLALMLTLSTYDSNSFGWDRHYDFSWSLLDRLRPVFGAKKNKKIKIFWVFQWKSDYEKRKNGLLLPPSLLVSNKKVRRKITTDRLGGTISVRVRHCDRRFDDCRNTRMVDCCTARGRKRRPWENVPMGRRGSVKSGSLSDWGCDLCS